MDSSRYRQNLENIIRELIPEISRKNSPAKVAILTWCNNNGPTNYGQILQCYAVQKILRNMGIEPLTVLYRRIPYIAPEEDIVRVQRFQEFINRYITVSKPCLSREMIENETSDCDLLICGSDQVWNPIHYDPMFLLDFGTDKQKRMALSVSGIFKRSDENDVTYRSIVNYLHAFDYISIREGHGADILNKFTDVTINTMPDPTLLLTEAEWDEVSTVDYLRDDDYVFCYFLGEIEDYLPQIESIKKQYKARIIKYIKSNIVHSRNIPNIEAVSGVGPSEFLSFVKNAKAIVTDSYHGACISIVYGKPFYCAKRSQKGGEVFGGKIRIESLKKDYGINISWITSKREMISKNENNKDILVSVIVPIFNSGEYLEEAMEGICNQTWTNLEIICVDDGSTDNSLDIISRFAKEDTRISIISQENQNAGIARNNGFEKIHGKYVMFLDSDDLFDPSLIEKMLFQAEKTTADIVICKSVGFDNETGQYLDIAGASLNEFYLPGTEVFSWRDIPDDIYRLKAKMGKCVIMKPEEYDKTKFHTFTGDNDYMELGNNQRTTKENRNLYPKSFDETDWDGLSELLEKGCKDWVLVSNSIEEREEAHKRLKDLVINPGCLYLYRDVVAFNVNARSIRDKLLQIKEGSKELWGFYPYDKIIRISSFERKRLSSKLVNLDSNSVIAVYGAGLRGRECRCWRSYEMR